MSLSANPENSAMSGQNPAPMPESIEIAAFPPSVDIKLNTGIKDNGDSEGKKYTLLLNQHLDAVRTNYL